jgi:DNA polymerase I-like protein with 3'-5' exonuclease and polymerase domains
MSPQKVAEPATASTVKGPKDSARACKQLSESLPAQQARADRRAAKPTRGIADASGREIGVVNAIARNNVALFPSLAGQGAIAIDCETYDPELKKRGPGAHRDGFIAGIAVGTEAGYRNYFPIGHEAGPNLPRGTVLSWLCRELQSDVPKIGANLIYDLAFLSAADVNVRGPFYDVQVALLDETRLSYSLENLAQHYLGQGKVEDHLETWIIEHFGKKNPKANVWRAPADVVAQYAIGDIDLSLRIFAKQEVELKKQKRLWELFLMESKLIPMLLAMRQRGVRVDLAKAEQLYHELTIKQCEASAAIKQMTGIEIAPWNARSIAQVFNHLGLEFPRTEKTDAPSFTKAWLEHHPHPVTDLIRRVRHLDKLRETFLQGFILEGHNNGRIHTQFNQLRSDSYGTVSGRLSSSTPNLQQIPVRSAEGKLIRSVFIPDEGQRFFKNDYSQIEYRLIVNDAAQLKLTGAQAAADKYNIDEKADFHQIVADMTGLTRDAAKTVNFGLAYGEGVAKLCASLGLNRQKGEALLNEYHQRAPFIKQLSNGYKQIAARTGEIRTLLGRIRRFNTWEIRRGGEVVYFRERRPASWRAFTHAALNARIQGSAADIMKLSMVNIWESGVCDALGAPHLTVHDELCGSYRDDKAGREALREFKHIMGNCVELLVPLKVDCGTGPNWGSCAEQKL